MTKEQIEELRRLDSMGARAPWVADVGTIHADVDSIIGVDDERLLQDEGLQGDINLAAAARNALPRLLAEREQLLKALKRADADAYDWSEDDTGSIVTAALAFAEESAP